MTTKELLALVGKWRADVESGTGYLNAESDNAVLYCADELAPIATALCAEVEALRKDAERYRWLRECAHLDSWGLDYELPTVCAIRFMPHSQTNEMHPDIDAAIDAAKEPK